MSTSKTLSRVAVTLLAGLAMACDLAPTGHVGDPVATGAKTDPKTDPTTDPTGAAGTTAGPPASADGGAGTTASVGSSAAGTMAAAGTTGGTAPIATTGAAGSVGSSGLAGTGSGAFACASGLPDAIKDLASLTSDSTVSRTTPMGTRYEASAKHVLTPADSTFLTDPHAQPAIPGSTSGLHFKALSVMLYPSGQPTPADINQHAIGNCDGDTAFASLAYQNPAFVTKLITDEHDGTFTVAMYDPMGRRLTVKLDSQFLVDGNGSIGAVSGKDGVADWATVLEKATMKYLQIFPVVGDIGGIGSEHQTPMFTGQGGSFAFDRGKLSPTELTRVAKAALAAGQLISGGFGIEGKALANGFETVTAHGYAVLVPKDAATMISMRNPWGVDPTSKGYNGSTDGVLDIPSDASWAATIDLRVIDPGDACGAGQIAPYVPPAAALTARAASVTEPHARPTSR